MNGNKIMLLRYKNNACCKWLRSLQDQMKINYEYLIKVLVFCNVNDANEHICLWMSVNESICSKTQEFKFKFLFNCSIRC